MASDLTHCFGVSTVDFGHVNADKVVTNFCENTPQKIKFFALTISIVNVTKSAGNCGFGHIY